MNENETASPDVSEATAKAASTTADKEKKLLKRVVILLSIPIAVLIVGAVATWWRPVTLLLICPVLKEMGSEDLAEPLAKRAIELYVKSEGINSRHTMWAVWNLAEIYREQGRFKKAEPLYKGLVDYNSKQKGEQAVMPLQALSGYSKTLRMVGKAREADRIDELLRKQPTKKDSS